MSSTLDRVNSRSANGGGSTNAGQSFHSKRIQAGLSTQIVIQVEEAGKAYTIGAIQRMNVTETRSLQDIYELGTDAIIQIVPNKAVTYDLTLDRIVFDFQRLPQALQRQYRHIHAQRSPFDIVVKDYNSYIQSSQATAPATAESVNARTAVETVYGNCWFKSLTVDYTQNDYLITEKCSMSCEYVYDRSTAPGVISGAGDTLEQASALSMDASIMSAFDAKNLG